MKHNVQGQPIRLPVPAHTISTSCSPIKFNSSQVFLADDALTKPLSWKYLRIEHRNSFLSFAPSVFLRIFKACLEHFKYKEVERNFQPFGRKLVLKTTMDLTQENWINHSSWLIHPGRWIVRLSAHGFRSKTVYPKCVFAREDTADWQWVLFSSFKTILMLLSILISRTKVSFLEKKHKKQGLIKGIWGQNYYMVKESTWWNFWYFPLRLRQQLCQLQPFSMQVIWQFLIVVEKVGGWQGMPTEIILKDC